MRNSMKLSFLGCPENEAFARTVIAAFSVKLNPTLSEVDDIKTAVSEAVTNAIVHGYRGTQGMVTLTAAYAGSALSIEIKDQGVGIPNVRQAMEPFFTTQPGEERSGMGFTVMQSFMDDVEVLSDVGLGTIVRMRKKIGSQQG